jgi:hypothetical protein
VQVTEERVSSKMPAGKAGTKKADGAGKDKEE